MPKRDLSAEKPVSTTFSKLLHFQSWVELASQPKSWCQHVSCSLAFSSRQCQSVLHSPDIKQCRGVSATLIQVISGMWKTKAGVLALVNIDWCNMVNVWPKKQKKLSYFRPHLLTERQAPVEFCSKSSRREVWTCVFRGRKHLHKEKTFPSLMSNARRNFIST